jgi:starvation-inducible DNA-binding protein
MDRKANSIRNVSAQRHLHQRAEQIQPYRSLSYALPLEPVQPLPLAPTERSNETLLDGVTIMISKESPTGQVAETASFERHLPFDKDYDKQAELCASLPKRIQPPGGVSVAMGRMSRRQRKSIDPPPHRGELPVQLSRIFDAHKVIIGKARKLARRAFQLGDERLSDLVVTEVLRMNELQMRFVSAHIMNAPVVSAGGLSTDASGGIPPAPIWNVSGNDRRTRHDSSE